MAVLLDCREVLAEAEAEAEAEVGAVEVSLLAAHYRCLPHRRRMLPKARILKRQIAARFEF